MKMNNVIPFFAVFPLILMGCTQDEVIKEDTSVGGKEKISVTVTQGGAITRISHEEDGANGLILKWTANDAFKLYGTTTEVFTTTGPTDGDGKIATFTGNAVEDAQHAFFPASKAEKRWEDCHFNVIGQVIDANAPFAHLSGYNFMTAQTTASGTEISEISFKHKIAVLKFEVTLPDGIVPKYITLSTQDDAGIAISQKASDESNVTTAKQLTAAISGASSENFTAYMAILPSTLKEKLALAVTGDDGMVYSYTVSFNGDFPYEAGKVYNSELTFGGIEGGFSKASVFDNNVSSTSWTNGTGDEGTPFLIENAAHLKHLVEQVNAQTSNSYSGKYFKLTTDIHVTATEWMPTGTHGKEFKGNFDGGGHTISGKLNISQNYGGTFGATYAASISNLHVAADITSDKTAVGGIVGWAKAATKVSSSFMSGSIISTYDGLCSIGGVVARMGYERSGGVISHCSMTGNIKSLNGSDHYVGGVVGELGISTTDKCLYSTNSGNITIEGTGSLRTGGIVGYVSSSNILYCQNRGDINIWQKKIDGLARIGGLVGQLNTGQLHTSHNMSANIEVVVEGGTNETGELAGWAGSYSVYDCCTSVDIAGMEKTGNNSPIATDNTNPHQ